MKKIFLCLLITMFTVTTINCNKEHNEKMVEVDQNTILYTQTNEVISYNEAAIILGNKGLVGLSSLGIKRFKKIGNLKYSVVMTEEGLYIPLFSENDAFVSMIPVMFSKDISFMDKVELGMDLNSVRDLDPNGLYDFIYHSWKDYPKISYHFYENGSALAIKYNDECKVSGILCFTI